VAETICLTQAMVEQNPNPTPEPGPIIDPNEPVPDDPAELLPDAPEPFLPRPSSRLPMIRAATLAPCPSPRD
jgi:hypothetical protein